MMRKLVILLVVTAGLLAGGLYILHTPLRPGGTSNDLIIEASPKDILDHVRELGSPLVLINFWASWCEPCKEEFPNLLALREKLGPKGLKVIFVSIDEPRDLQAAEEFLREHKVDFQTYYKGSQNIQFVSQIYPKWEGAVPTTILIGPKLDIVDAWDGITTLAEFEQRILRQLRGT